MGKRYELPKDYTMTTTALNGYVYVFRGEKSIYGTRMRNYVVWTVGEDGDTKEPIDSFDLVKSDFISASRWGAWTGDLLVRKREERFKLRNDFAEYYNTKEA